MRNPFKWKLECVAFCLKWEQMTDPLLFMWEYSFDFEMVQRLMLFRMHRHSFLCHSQSIFYLLSSRKTKHSHSPQDHSPSMNRKLLEIFERNSCAWGVIHQSDADGKTAEKLLCCWCAEDDEVECCMPSHITTPTDSRATHRWPKLMLFEFK